MDGCGPWRILRSVFLPLLWPALVSTGLLAFIAAWNEFLFALILTGERVPMATVVMAQFVSEMGIEWNLMAATAVLALVPAFVLTLFGQKYVLKGLKM